MDSFAKIIALIMHIIDLFRMLFGGNNNNDDNNNNNSNNNEYSY